MEYCLGTASDIVEGMKRSAYHTHSLYHETHVFKHSLECDSIAVSMVVNATIQFRDQTHIIYVFSLVSSQDTVSRGRNRSYL